MVQSWSRHKTIGSGTIMAKKDTNSKKRKFLNPDQPLDCMRTFLRRGMSKSEARKHCNSLWKKEESRRDESRVIGV